MSVTNRVKGKKEGRKKNEKGKRQISRNGILKMDFVGSRSLLSVT